MAKNALTLKEETLHITSYASDAQTTPKPNNLPLTEAEMICLKHYQFSIDVITKNGTHIFQ